MEKKKRTEKKEIQKLILEIKRWKEEKARGLGELSWVVVKKLLKKEWKRYEEKKNEDIKIKIRQD